MRIRRVNGKNQGKNQGKKEFAVIGLGHFGASLARRLEMLGHVVLGIDIEPARVQAIVDDVTSAVVLDATDEDALQEVDIATFGTVIIGIDEDFEASALVTAYLKGLGIGRLICLAKTSRHRDILRRIGADQVILSDEDSGLRLAETLAQPDMLEHVLFDEERSLVEMKTPERLITQPVSSLAKLGVTAILIQRGDRLLPCPDAATRLEAGDTLFVVGQREHLLQTASLP